MPRHLLAASVLLAVGRLSTVAAGEVADEFVSITAAFSQAMQDGGRTTENFVKAVSERDAALIKLAERAEAAASEEHVPLARIYVMLKRNDEAIRHAQAALAEEPADVVSHMILIQSLTNAERHDDAETALRAMLALKVDDEGAAQYFATTPTALAAVVGRQTAKGDFAAAVKLLDEWQKKVDELMFEDETAKAAVQRAQRSTALLRSRVASESARAELIGKPYFPLEKPTWLNGSPLAPEELRGKVVLLDFWAVWCGPCIATFPHLIEWHDKYADKGLVIVGVTRRYKFDWDAEAQRPKFVEALEPAKEDSATTEFAKHHGLKHRIAVVDDAEISRKYAVTGIPQVVVIDQTGTIRKIHVGSGEVGSKEVEQEIRKLLGLDEAAGTP